MQWPWALVLRPLQRAMSYLRAHDVLLRRRVARVKQVLVGHVVDACNHRYGSTIAMSTTVIAFGNPHTLRISPAANYMSPSKGTGHSLPGPDPACPNSYVTARGGPCHVRTSNPTPIA